MEKYTMFMDRKNQYSENEYTTQSNLQIQCNPFQATSDIFHRTRTNNFHSLLWWTIFSQTSPPWPIHLGWPHMAWLNFIWLDKVVVCVIRLASCLWLCFSLSALWCPLSAPTILHGLLLPWTWGISSLLLQQSRAAALWKILKEMGIPDHLTCLLRNLYAGQEATVRTGHGTTD